MRNELERIVAEYGTYWGLALIAVAISKLYIDEPQRLKTVIRSFVAATLYTFLFVEFSRDRMSEWMLYLMIVLGSFLVDGIAFALVKLRARIKEDPSIILKFIPWLKRGGK